MLEIKNVSKSFGDKKVLSDFNLTPKNNSVTAIMGRSGCGKTTLFMIILGLVEKDGGEVFKDGLEIRAVFQDDRLLENRTALENLLFVSKDENTAKKLLAKFGLSDSLDIPCSKLSGGMKRRVAFARALITNPDVLLLDEPYNALDAETKRILINSTAEYAESHTVLLITHNKDEADMLNADIINLG